MVLARSGLNFHSGKKQALLILQLLNKTAALAEGIDDVRFTRQFIVVTSGLIVYACSVTSKTTAYPRFIRLIF